MGLNGGMKVELPYLLRDTDRHGNERIYFRRPGQRMVRLRSTLGTPEFLEEYRTAAKGEAGTKPTPPTKIIAGSLRDLIASYYRAAEFLTLDASTQRARRGILDGICESTAPTGAQRGTLPVSRLEPRHIEEMRDEKIDLPEAANGRVKALRQVFKWAKRTRKLANPAAEVEYLPGSSDGFYTWTIDEVRQYEKRHPIGTKARLALALLLYTGVRRSDVVKLGPGMESNGWLRFTEKKNSTSRAITRRKKVTPKRRDIPVLPELRAIIAATPSGHMTYLVTAFGRPFTANGFGNKFRDWCNEAGLPHCAAHGLRKAGATIASDNGATTNELMAIYGWESIQQAELYTRKANRKLLAGKAMHLVVPLVTERKED